MPDRSPHCLVAARSSLAPVMGMIPLLLLAASCAGRGRAESLVSSSSVPFTMAAISQDSAFAGTFTGRMRAAGDDVELLFDAGRLTYTGVGRYAGPREVGSVAFAFAQGDRADYWRVASRSDRTRLRRVVAAGAELVLDSLRVRIDRRGLPLSEYWLVVEIENVLIDVPATSQARGLAYLHSDRTFFRAMR